MTPGQEGLPHTVTTAENIVKVDRLVRSNRRLTLQMMAEELSLKTTSVRNILVQELGMRKVCPKMVPKLLSDDQKEHHANVCGMCYKR